MVVIWVTIEILGLAACQYYCLHGQVDNMCETPAQTSNSVLILIQYQYITCIHNVLAFDVESRPHLDFVAACEFLKHRVIALRIITGDVPDLENQLACQWRFNL
jgi:hypothetical protein